MKKSFSQRLYLLLIVIIFLSSCSTGQKFVYFQKDVNQGDTISIPKAYVPRIQSGDILSVYIGSLSAAASSFFNPFSSAGAASAPTDNTNTGALAAGNAIAGASAAQTAPNSYLVDPNGAIEIPILGPVKVAGLTTVEAKDTIKNRLKLYLKEPTVNVRFLNYKISVMGEATRPGVYVIPNEKVTLPEALSMAGDLTVYGRYDNILVIRDNNGKKEFGRVNLNNREVFTSPYYYLHSGDLIYIEQGRIKAAQTDPSTRYIPLILSTIAALALLTYRFK